MNQIFVQLKPRLESLIKRMKQEGLVECPDCRKRIPNDMLREHIRDCAEYVPTYINNVARFMEHMSPDYIRFLSAEMEIIQEELQRKINEERVNGVKPRPAGHLNGSHRMK